MLTELPRSVFVLKVGGTYYTYDGVLRAFLDAASAAEYKSDTEPFQDNAIAVVEMALDALFTDVKTKLPDDVSLVVCSWDDGEKDPVVIYDPAATIN